MITIYHNPRCSKSREALAITEKFAVERQVPLEIVDYIKSPLSLAQLITLQRQLGTEARAMVRDNEPGYAALGLENADDTKLLEAVAEHPTLLQRPIVVCDGRAVIGRPPERVNDLLEKG
jgi:arsenate reductase